MRGCDFFGPTSSNFVAFMSQQTSRRKWKKVILCVQTTHLPLPQYSTLDFFPRKNLASKKYFNVRLPWEPEVTFGVHKARWYFLRFALGLHPARQIDNSITVSPLTTLRNILSKHLLQKEIIAIHSWHIRCCVQAVRRKEVVPPAVPEAFCDGFRSQNSGGQSRVDRDQIAGFLFLEAFISMASLRASPVKSSLTLAC